MIIKRTLDKRSFYLALIYYIEEFFSMFREMKEELGYDVQIEQLLWFTLNTKESHFMRLD